MNRRKKCICTIMMILVFAMTGCGKKSDTSLYDKGLELTEVLVEMAESEEYLDAFGIKGEQYLSYVEEIREGKYKEPKKVYVLTVSEKGIENMLEEMDMEDVSEELQQIVIRRMFGSITTQINAQMGSTPLAVSSIYNASTTFECGDMEEYCIYIYEYKRALPVVVTFVKGEDNIVGATASFLMSQDLLDDLEETLDDMEFYEEMGLEIEVLDMD